MMQINRCQTSMNFLAMRCESNIWVRKKDTCCGIQQNTIVTMWNSFGTHIFLAQWSGNLRTGTKAKESKTNENPNQFFTYTETCPRQPF